MLLLPASHSLEAMVFNAFSQLFVLSSGLRARRRPAHPPSRLGLCWHRLHPRPGLEGLAIILGLLPTGPTLSRCLELQPTVTRLRFQCLRRRSKSLPAKVAHDGATQ